LLLFFVEVELNLIDTVYESRRRADPNNPTVDFYFRENIPVNNLVGVGSLM